MKKTAKNIEKYKKGEEHNKYEILVSEEFAKKLNDFNPIKSINNFNFSYQIKGQNLLYSKILLLSKKLKIYWMFMKQE